MVIKEFNLSDKIHHANKWAHNANVVHKDDVKEFIKMLKEIGLPDIRSAIIMKEKINRLAGENLWN